MRSYGFKSRPRYSKCTEKIAGVLIVIVTCLFLMNVNLMTYASIERPDLRIHGVKIFVSDLDVAKQFYTSFLRLEEVGNGTHGMELSTGQYPIYLAHSNKHIPRSIHLESHYAMSFLVSKLMPAIDEARDASYQLYDTMLSRNGVGIHILISDPSGNMLHLMGVQIRAIPKFEGFRLYNSGSILNDVPAAETFYKEHVGFKDWSGDYLPNALPLKHADGSFAFMLHENKELAPSTYQYGLSPGTALMLETNNLKSLVSYLNSQSIKYEKQEDAILIRDWNENTTEIIERP